MSTLRFAWWQARLRVLLVLGRQRAALACLRQWLACAPDDAHALATWAHLLAGQGDHAAALVVLQRLVVLQPDRASHWFNLGFVNEQLGQAVDAEAAFTRATQIDARLDRAWYGLALSLIAQRRFEDAVSALRMTTELQPMSPHAWYQLARVHVDQLRPDQATQIIQHLRGFEPRVAAQLVRETGLGQL